MNWEAIGAIGEIIGAMAVVITLIFLTLQLRQNTKSTKLATRTNIMEAYSGIIGSMQDPQFADCILKGMSDFESLNANEKLRFTSFIQRQLRIWEITFFHWKEGELDDIAWRGTKIQMSDTLSLPGVQRVFEIRTPWLDERFTEYARQLLSDIPRKANLPYLDETEESANLT